MLWKCFSISEQPRIPEWNKAGDSQGDKKNYVLNLPKIHFHWYCLHTQALYKANIHSTYMLFIKKLHSFVSKTLVLKENIWKTTIWDEMALKKWLSWREKPLPLVGIHEVMQTHTQLHTHYNTHLCTHKLVYKYHNLGVLRKANILKAGINLSPQQRLLDNFQGDSFKSNNFLKRAGCSREVLTQQLEQFYRPYSMSGVKYHIYSFKKDDFLKRLQGVHWKCWHNNRNSFTDSHDM